jgi:DNA-binding protein HU-beta
MAKETTKSAIINHLAGKVEPPKKKGGETLEAITEPAYKEAKNAFTVPSLGNLVIVNRKARMGRNRATGEAIKIPAKRVLNF